MLPFHQFSTIIRKKSEKVNSAHKWGQVLLFACLKNLIQTH